MKHPEHLDATSIEVKPVPNGWNAELLYPCPSGNWYCCVGFPYVDPITRERRGDGRGTAVGDTMQQALDGALKDAWAKLTAIGQWPKLPGQ